MININNNLYSTENVSSYSVCCVGRHSGAVIIVLQLACQRRSASAIVPVVRQCRSCWPSNKTVSSLVPDTRIVGDNKGGCCR